MGQCVDCPPGTPDKILTAGRCYYHYKRLKNIEYFNRQKTKPQGDGKVFNVGRKTELSNWYSVIMDTEPAVCWNCNQAYDWIKRPQFTKLWHSAIAHILPKNFFPSVKTHPKNFAILFSGWSGTTCDCHDQFDKYYQNTEWEKLEGMRVWTVVKQRFKEIEPFVATNEKRLIPEIFLSP